MQDRAVLVSSTKLSLRVELADGRVLFVPLAWFPTLQEATQEERDRWRLIGDGLGIRWPDLDEDLSVRTLLRSDDVPEAVVADPISDTISMGDGSVLCR